MNGYDASMVIELEEDEGIEGDEVLCICWPGFLFKLGFIYAMGFIEMPCKIGGLAYNLGIMMLCFEGCFFTGGAYWGRSDVRDGGHGPLYLGMLE